MRGDITGAITGAVGGTAKSAGLFSVPGESLATAITQGIFGIVSSGQQAELEKQRAAYNLKVQQGEQQAQITGAVSAGVAAEQRRQFWMKMLAGAAGVALVGAAVYIGYKAIRRK